MPIGIEACADVEKLACASIDMNIQGRAGRVRRCLPNLQRDRSTNLRASVGKSFGRVTARPGDKGDWHSEQEG